MTTRAAGGDAQSVEDASRWTDLARLGAIAFQLGVLALVIHQFEIESTAFLQLAILTFAGFLVHSLLPHRHRLPFFAALSLAGIALVLGLKASAALVCIGVVLIGICHLPLRFPLRVMALAVTGASLAVVRADWISVPGLGPVWPILGSMFMFRLCVYLYDLQHDTERPSVARTFSYFFMLPNVCFPLFPVIDFKAFRRTYYNEEAFEIYQKGVGWMFRGIVQLIVYRFVYYHLTLEPSQVATVPDLVQYLTSNFLLYLRVSGSFHLIVGMLHLFGFNLPPTHYLYFLASSFNDFWRRINIYWKDFMMKLFYYPAYFKLRRFGATAALVIATFFVFLSTWLLHSYQWFWLRGSFPIHWQDGAFWGVLAVLVVANSLYEARYGRVRSLGKRAWTAGSLAGPSLRTLGTFCAICVLWSLWTSESLSQWLSLWSLPGGLGLGDTPIAITVLLVGAVWFGGTMTRTPSASEKQAGAHGPRPGFWRAALVTGLCILALYALGHPAVYSRLGARGEIVESVRSSQLNTLDASRLEAGYYEGLLRVDRFNSQLWEVYMRNPDSEAAWNESNRIVKWPEDFLLRGLRPDMQMRFRGSPYSTNRWGMRDRDYEQTKRPGTIRLAFLGSSVVMGAGVGDGENFESLLERRLVRDHGDRYEILNFAVSEYGPVEQVAMAPVAFDFDPDVLVLVAHHHDAERAVSHLARVRARDVRIPYSELAAIADRAGVTPGTSVKDGQRLLRPMADEIVAWANQEIVRMSLEQGVRPVWVFMPVLHDRRDDGSALAALARKAGFPAVIDLTGVFDGHDRRQLRISNADIHPNLTGHEFLAERLYEHFTAAGLLGPSDALRRSPTRGDTDAIRH